ncbi:MAG: helix-turn-helix domain-containing protein [Acidimicrobiia bacterium]|nr:MAG: helix-turn-helix domain-containing protein [Acidimicrobiia bacterium]
MGTQERRQRERQERRRAILDATRHLVRRHGFAGTTTRQIAERCELSEATLFIYFSSKDEIMISLLGEASQFWAEGLDTILDAGGDPAEKLDRLWRFFGEVQERHPEYVHVSTYLAHPRPEQVAPEVATDLIRRTGENFRRLSDLMAALGVAEPRVAADLLWSAFLGMMVLREGRAHLGAPQHPDADDLESALALLTRALAP